jgi:saccharopine dehydrogenase-like NADP-dependent oxidoreductase
MSYDFLIFGAGGMQGKIVSRDLIEKNYNVFLSDISQPSLQEVLDKYPKTKFAAVDLREKQAIIDLVKKVAPAVVINCAEADWNVNVYDACLEANVHVIDLGSDIPMTKEQLAKSSEFKKKDLLAITGCGSTPGINNIMLDYAVNLFDTLDTVEAGFAWNSNIKQFVVPFSIPSIVEEFTEPASLMENGKWIKKDPLDNVMEKKFRKIGKQKCFFVRHPEPLTFYLNYKKKGLKNVKFYAGFPDHSFETIYNFVNLGFGTKNTVDINGKGVVPVDVLTEILKKNNPPEGYTEKENLWVEVVGQKEGKEQKVLMECIVHTLPGWDDAGCNIDTAIPASIIAQMIKNGQIKERGSFPPEAIVPKDEFFKGLKEKEMLVYMNGRLIN